MDFFPFFRRPYYYSEPWQNRYIYNSYRTGRKNIKKQMQSNSEQDKANKNNNVTDRYRDESCQQIMGFNSDDILIIVLLLFLYSEGVRDNILFIVLILLLLT